MIQLEFLSVPLISDLVALSKFHSNIAHGSDDRGEDRKDGQRETRIDGEGEGQSLMFSWVF